MKILCPDPKNFSNAAINFLQKKFDLTLCTPDEFLALNSLNEFDCLLIRFNTIIDKKVLNKLQHLKYILCPTTGLDHIDVNSAEKRGIKIISLKGDVDFLKSITSTAELAFLLILSSVRKVNVAFDEVYNRNWNLNIQPGNELKNKTIGILGLGRLGNIVAKYAKCFDMNVYYFDIEEKTDIYYNRVNSLEELIEVSDILSIHIPLNKKTKGLIGQNEFRIFNRCKYLINTSRGAIINSKSLIQYMDRTSDFHAALDVLEDEKNPENSLVEYSLKNKNLIITPHIGGNTKEAIENTDMHIINKFLKIIDKW
jgi:D-3-phosphoglycerate dehydrogenase / 2-oxoglutarate reductase